MENKILKYQEYLDRFPKCPPSDFSNDDLESFRWINEKPTESDFIPLNLIKDPPQRILDDSDLMCTGYGLSFFDTLVNAYNRYVSLYKKRREHLRNDFITDYGSSIARINLNKCDGLKGNYNTESGHFTFHMYDDSSLISQIGEILNIFDDNGEINNITEE
ncbi:MAG: hypothetical protein JXR05_10100 [Flavobacteriaceae bacterium]